MHANKDQEIKDIKNYIKEGTKINIEKLDENIVTFQEITKQLADKISTIRNNYSLDSQNGLISSLIIRIIGQYWELELCLVNESICFDRSLEATQVKSALNFERLNEYGE